MNFIFKSTFYVLRHSQSTKLWLWWTHYSSIFNINWIESRTKKTKRINNNGAVFIWIIANNRPRDALTSIINISFFFLLLASAVFHPGIEIRSLTSIAFGVLSKTITPRTRKTNTHTHTVHIVPIYWNYYSNFHQCELTICQQNPADFFLLLSTILILLDTLSCTVPLLLTLWITYYFKWMTYCVRYYYVVGCFYLTDR